VCDPKTDFAEVTSARPLRTLPDGYAVKRIIDFTKGSWILVMNLLALPSLLLFGSFFYLVAVLVRSGDSVHLFSTLADLSFCLPILFLVFLSIILHELIHGLGFWWFTRTRPRFGYTLWGAYAAAPDWYLSRNQHLIIGLSPFVTITSIGGLLLFVVPASWVSVVVCLLVLNAASAMGDLLVCFFEMREGRSTLIQDTGMRITFYCPG
jgi:hypothetical protein